MTNDAAFWDRIAARYAKQPVKNQATYEQTLTRTRAHLNPEYNALEVGCGAGSTAIVLARHVRALRAIDVSTRMIKIAKRKTTDAGQVTFAQGTLDDPSLELGGYDVVMAFNLLHLLTDAEAAVDRVRDLLKPNGLFISKTACLSERGVLLRPMVYVMRMLGRAPYMRFFGVEELERMIEGAGFNLVETDSHPHPNRFIVARRR